MLRRMSTKSGGTECNGDDIQSRWQTKPNHSVNQHGLFTRFWFHITRVGHGIGGGVYKDALLRPRIVYNRLCYRVLKHNHFPLFL